MILNRHGNKSRLAPEIVKHIPFDTITHWIEPFFGAGGLFFNKPICKRNTLNDADKTIFHLWTFAKDPKNLERVVEELEYTPLNEDVFKYYKYYSGDDPLEKVIATLYTTTFGVMSIGATIRTDKVTVQKPIKKIKQFLKSDALVNATFTNKDFRLMLRSVSGINKDNAFVYFDPPYLDTSRRDYRDGGGWTQQDTEDVFKIAIESGLRFAISETNHPFVVEQAKKYNLNIIEINTSKCFGAMKFNRKEFLYTNYKSPFEDLRLF